MLAAGAGPHVDQMLTYTAAGTPSDVRRFLLGFLRDTRAEEIVTVHPAPVSEDRLRSITLLAQVMADA